MEKQKDIPLNLKTLKKKAQKSKKKIVRPFPNVKVEIARIWYGEDQMIIPHVQLVEGEKPYAMVEVIVSPGADFKPPSIKGDDIRKQVQKSKLENLKNAGQGFYNHCMDTRYLPEPDQKIPSKKVRGEEEPTNVFGTDTRYVYNDTSFPWCTVGRVETQLGIATGCMIGKNLMLTCSHAIEWNSDGTAGWVKFYPAYYNGTRPLFGSAWGTRVVFWNKASSSGGPSAFETAFDYVVVVLDRNLGDLTGFPGYRTYDRKWNRGRYWQYVGYPEGVSGTMRPVFFGHGSVSSAQNQLQSGYIGYAMGHFMDITGGHSGGPFWGWWEDEPWPRVVGVQSAETDPSYVQAGENEAGGGPALSTIISYARKKY